MRTLLLGLTLSLLATVATAAGSDTPTPTQGAPTTQHKKGTAHPAQHKANPAASGRASTAHAHPKSARHPAPSANTAKARPHPAPPKAAHAGKAKSSARTHPKSASAKGKSATAARGKAAPAHDGRPTKPTCPNGLAQC